MIVINTEAEIIKEEHRRLVPKICMRCRHGIDELIKDARDGYAHRSMVGAMLDNCDARVLHELLGTPVKVHLKDED